MTGTAASALKDSSSPWHPNLPPSAPTSWWWFHSIIVSGPAAQRDCLAPRANLGQNRNPQSVFSFGADPTAHHGDGSIVPGGCCCSALSWEGRSLNSCPMTATYRPTRWRTRHFLSTQMCKERKALLLKKRNSLLFKKMLCAQECKSDFIKGSLVKRKSRLLTRCSASFSGGNHCDQFPGGSSGKVHMYLCIEFIYFFAF